MGEEVRVKTYGTMMGYEDAIAWVEKHTPDCQERTEVLNRMGYECDMNHALKPVYYKGIHGRRFDAYACRKCGAEVRVLYNFCPECGRRIAWDGIRCLTEYKNPVMVNDIEQLFKPKEGTGE